MSTFKATSLNKFRAPSISVVYNGSDGPEVRPAAIPVGSGPSEMPRDIHFGALRGAH